MGFNVKVKSKEFMGEYIALHGYLPKRELPVRMRDMPKNDIYVREDITEDRKKYILENSPVPFNAGQFMFKNTNVMEGHFAAVLWLSSVWPGVFFFEQSFMNFYFTLHEMVKKEVLNNWISW